MRGLLVISIALALCALAFAYTLIRKVLSYDAGTDRMKEIASQDPAPEERVSIAGGIAVFENGNDLKVADVFTRADAAMYDDKVEIKKIL